MYAPTDSEIHAMDDAEARAHISKLLEAQRAYMEQRFQKRLREKQLAHARVGSVLGCLCKLCKKYNKNKKLPAPGLKAEDRRRHAKS